MVCLLTNKRADSNHPDVYFILVHILEYENYGGFDRTTIAAKNSQKVLADFREIFSFLVFSHLSFLLFGLATLSSHQRPIPLLLAVHSHFA